jgi:hypothetical protein
MARLESNSAGTWSGELSGLAGGVTSGRFVLGAEIDTTVHQVRDKKRPDKSPAQQRPIVCQLMATAIAAITKRMAAPINPPTMWTWLTGLRMGVASAAFFGSSIVALALSELCGIALSFGPKKRRADGIVPHHKKKSPECRGSIGHHY